MNQQAETEDLYDDSEITLFDLGVSAGFTEEWVQEEMLATVAAIGMTILQEEQEETGNCATSVIITVPFDDEGDIEIIVRRAAVNKKRRLH
jgi:hypothetical protein